MLVQAAVNKQALAVGWIEVIERLQLKIFYNLAWYLGICGGWLGWLRVEPLLELVLDTRIELATF